MGKPVLALFVGAEGGDGGPKGAEDSFLIPEIPVCAAPACVIPAGAVFTLPI
jgi:hypothetical protein